MGGHRGSIYLGLGALDFGRHEVVDQDIGAEAGRERGELGPGDGVLRVGRGQVRQLTAGGVDQQALVGVDHHVGDLALLEAVEHAEDRVIDVLGGFAQGESGEGADREADRMGAAGGGGGLLERVAGLEAGLDEGLEGAAEIDEALAALAFGVVGRHLGADLAEERLPGGFGLVPEEDGGAAEVRHGVGEVAGGTELEGGGGDVGRLAELDGAGVGAKRGQAPGLEVARGEEGLDGGGIVAHALLEEGVGKVGGGLDGQAVGALGLERRLDIGAHEREVAGIGGLDGLGILRVVGRLREARRRRVEAGLDLGLGDRDGGEEVGGGEVHGADDDARADLVAEGIILEKFGELGGAGVDGRGVGLVVGRGDVERPLRVGAAELGADILVEDVAGTADEQLGLADADVVGEHAGDVGLGDAAGLEVVAESGVPDRVEFAVVAGEGGQGLDMVGDLGLRRGREVELVGQVEGGGALERVLLELFGAEAGVAELEGGAQVGVAEDAGLAVLGAEIVTEELARQRLAVGATEAGGGVRDEHEGDDDEAQQHAEDELKVLLKIALNPGDHGRKTA